jgi:hypothetical protein
MSRAIVETQLHPKTAVEIVNRLNKEKFPEFKNNAEREKYVCDVLNKYFDEYKQLEEKEGNNDVDSICKILTICGCALIWNLKYVIIKHKNIQSIIPLHRYNDEFKKLLISHTN